MKTTLRLALLSALFTAPLIQAADLIPIDVHRDACCAAANTGSAIWKATVSRSMTMSKPT
jgi:hypothetical protein